MKINKIINLVNTITKLRSKDGCPWDNELDLKSLSKLTLEECYELLDSIESGDPTKIVDELSDLLTHILFYASIGESNKIFDIEDVIENANKKLISRHPHVFDKENFGTLESSEDVKKNWDLLKNKDQKKSFLDNFNFLGPSSILATRIIKKLLDNNIKIDEEGSNYKDINIFKLYFYLLQNDGDPEFKLREEILRIKENIKIEEKKSGKNFENFQKNKIIKILFES